MIKFLTKIKVNKRELFFCFLLFPHFELMGVLTHVPGMMEINRIWRVISACYCLPFCVSGFIHNKALKDIHVVPLMYLLFLMSMTVSTIVNNQSVYEFGKLYYASILLIAYLDIMMKKRANDIIDSLYLSLCIVVILNFITVIRGGILASYRFADYGARIYFIGSKNKSILIICMAMIAILLHKEIHEKLSFLGLTSFVICVITPFLTRSAQGAVIVGIILASYILLHATEKVRYIITYKNVLIVIGVLLFLVLSARMVWASFLLKNILHKDLTFTGRTMIWGNALELIRLKPILGYGFQLDLLSVFTLSGKETTVGTHCDYLQFLLYGGVIMLMIFVCTLLALLKCKKCSNYRINVIIYTGIFCLLLNMIVDNLENWFPVFLMFCLMENSVHICKNMHEEKILLIQKKQSVVK